MRLRNKKTGEIVEATDFNIISDYTSLAKLNEEWEDAPEEPKEYWFINGSGEVIPFCEDYEDEEGTKACKDIGNYFNTREEAEKAVEKLKAWKRLKEKIIDRVLKYEFDELTEDIHSNISFSVESYPSVGNDLDLLFGGKE